MPNQTPTRYRADFVYLPTLLKPTLLRRSRFTAWLLALLAPLRQLYATVLLYQAASFRELSYNGQTIRLEGALNDQFDPDARRIRIDNSDLDLTPIYFNFVSEQQPEKYLLFAPESPPWTYAFLYVEFSTQTDFTVHVPVVLRTDQRTNQLNARIKHFKLAMRHHVLLFDL